MSQRQILKPSPDHPISIEPTKGRVVVTAGGKKIAESRKALSLRESTYPVVHYIPLADVDPNFIVRSDHQTHCPYKGIASYHSIVVDGTNGENAIGCTKTRMRPWPRSKITSRSIRTESN